MNLKSHTSMTKKLKLKVRKVWGIVLTFAEDTEKKLVGGGPFCPPLAILNRVKVKMNVASEIMKEVFEKCP